MVSGPRELQREISDTASRLRLAAYEEGYNDGYEQAKAETEDKALTCECEMSDGTGDEVDYIHHMDIECCSFGCYHTLYLQNPSGNGTGKFGPNPRKGV